MRSSRHIRATAPIAGPSGWSDAPLPRCEARGKHLLVRFEGDLTLHSHLRMTDAWGVYERGRSWHRTAHKAWLVMRAGEWEVVQFDGPVLELMGERRIRSDRRLAELGPDVFGEDFEEALFLASPAR